MHSLPNLFAALSIRLLCALPMVAVAAATATAEDRTLWDHNGSIMLLTIGASGFTIHYYQPRAGLARHGIEGGTLLFDGTEQPGGFIEGNARVFRRNCPPAEYYVSGQRYDDDNAFVLRGASPVRESGGCAVVEYSETSSNAALRFDFVGLADARDDPPADNAGGACGWYTVLACGRNRGAISAVQNDLGAFDADIIDTSGPDFPNFRAGFFCLAIGPMGRNDALATADEWKGYGSSDAYAKNSCQ